MFLFLENKKFHIRAIYKKCFAFIIQVYDLKYPNELHSERQGRATPLYKNSVMSWGNERLIHFIDGLCRRLFSKFCHSVRDGAIRFVILFF